jgi:hypothetical protein
MDAVKEAREEMREAHAVERDGNAPGDGKAN